MMPQWLGLRAAPLEYLMATHPTCYLWALYWRSTTWPRYLSSMNQTGCNTPLKRLIGDLWASHSDVVPCSGPIMLPLTMLLWQPYSSELQPPLRRAPLPSCSSPFTSHHSSLPPLFSSLLLRRRLLSPRLPLEPFRVRVLHSQSYLAHY